MITRAQIKQIVFIEKNIFNKELFRKSLIKQFDLYEREKISRDAFNRWLDAWSATAELDLDPTASARIRSAYREVRSGKSPCKTWKDFKASLISQ